MYTLRKQKVELPLSRTQQILVAHASSRFHFLLPEGVREVVMHTRFGLQVIHPDSEGTRVQIQVNENNPYRRPPFTYIADTH